jgi:hypothetical protein
MGISRHLPFGIRGVAALLLATAVLRADPVTLVSARASFHGGEPEDLAHVVREHGESAMVTSEIRFIRGKDGAGYAFVMAVPQAAETLRIRALGLDAGLLGKSVQRVTLMGADDLIRWKQERDALVIDYPGSADFSFEVVFRIE